MITLVTAVPGSGKTLHIVKFIDEEQQKPDPRPIYHNIDGLKPEKFPHPNLLFEAPSDWRDTPDGSIVIYDECQQPHLYPANAQKGTVHDERLTAMEVHRHTGHDLIFITQSPSFVHHHVRKLVGEHIHFYRGRGIGGATKYTWSHVCNDPNDRKEQERADSEFWKFPKKYFDYYKSATKHTHKFKMPAKAWRILFMLLAVFGYAGWYLYQNDGFSLAKSQQQDQRASERAGAQQHAPRAAPEQDFPNSPFNWTTKAESIPVMGCASNNNQCVCYGKNGSPLHMPNAACMSVISTPFSSIRFSKN